MDDVIFRRNLLALSARHQELCDCLVRTEPDPRLAIRSSRSGLPVPVLRLDTREAAFHSLMDPQREAERLVEAGPQGGFIVALGLGAGYAIRAHLTRRSTSSVIALEYSAPLLRALLDSLDLSEIFVDRRFRLLLDPTSEELEEAVLLSYLPAISGDILTAPLRGRTDLSPAEFSLAAETVRSVLGRISDDYSVQAFFGKLWFRNAVRNLLYSERPTSPLPPIRRAVVTAAGPSLEDGIAAAAKAQAEGAFLIATDTTLPALLGRGLRPQAVISIDCQAISYYHFMKGMPHGIPLVLDLASPNRLARLSDSVRFFSSGHPFCAYVSSNYRPFPALDTSGGNVTHAALSLAEALGAESCLLVGADFSYPEGKSYARGTYIYDYFDGRSGRLAPTESLFTGFVRRNTSILRELDRDENGREYARYVTKPLLAYRSHLERFIGASAMDIHPLRGKGVEIRCAPPADRRQRRQRTMFSAGPASQGAAAFLSAYAVRLRGLAVPEEPAAAFIQALDPKDRDLWMTLIPSVSALRRAWGAKAMAPAEALEAGRAWALAELEIALNDQSGIG
jgi:hypothetical protein